MIVVISTEKDVHARAILTQLARRSAACRLLDLSLYPTRSALTIDYGARGERFVWESNGGSEPLDFRDGRVVWWRRPQPFAIDPAISDDVNRNFAIVEAHSAFSGLWLTLDAFWINHPTRDEEAARKVYQLMVAREVGLRVPETRITSSVEDAREFIGRREPGKTVYKAFSGTEHAWRETRVMKPDELEKIENVRYAPVIFQEYIPAGIDLRITVIGDRVFPAAINLSETNYEVDFRMVMSSARFAAATLPPGIEEALLQLMQRLGLVYGAIDMRRTPDGEYVFLEINPAGQWLFVEERTGQPITEALADLMLSRDR